MATRYLLLVASVAIVAASCTNLGSTEGDPPDRSTTSFIEIVEPNYYDVGQMSLYAVVTVTLGDSVDTAGGRTLFAASVDQKYYDIGRFTRNADPTVVDRTLDTSEIEVFVPDYLLVATGDTLTVALSTRPYEDRNVWTVRAALTPDGLTVHQNEQPGIKQSLALATNPGETLRETLVVLSEEFRVWLSARDEAMKAVRSLGRDAMLDAAREVPRGVRHERIDASQDDQSEAPDEADDESTETDTDWSWSWTVDYSLETFESATQLSQSMVSGILVGVETPRWNTASGDQGRRSEWRGSSEDPLQWQILTIEVSETISTGVDDYGVRPVAPESGLVRVAYLVQVPGYVEVSPKMVGSGILVGVTSSEIGYLDAPTQYEFVIDPQASYIAPEPDGQAYRFFSAATGSTYLSAIDAGATADGKTADIAYDIDYLVNRARAPSLNLEDHLGYSDLTE